MQIPWDAVCWPSSVIGLTPCSVTSPGWAAGRWHVHGLPCCHQIRRPCSVCRPGALTTCCLALSPFAPAWPNFCMSGVAQWSACWAHNPKVPGSKPGSAIRGRAGHADPLGRRALAKQRDRTHVMLCDQSWLGSWPLARSRPALRPPDPSATFCVPPRRCYNMLPRPPPFCPDLA